MKSSNIMQNWIEVMDNKRNYVQIRNFITSFVPFYQQINGLVQDCRYSSVFAMELLQSCTKPWTYYEIKAVENGLYFTDYMLKCIFVKENYRMMSKIWRKFDISSDAENQPSLDKTNKQQAILWGGVT